MGFVETIERSWEITKLTFAVMKKDKELFLFPILSAIFSILFFTVMIVPSVFSYLSKGETGVGNMIFYLIVFAIYFGLAFIATFFSVCVVYTAKKRFEGGDSKFAEAIRFAISRIGIIVAWSLVSATVGLILRVIDELAENLGDVGKMIVRLLVGLLGAAWSIITIFVVPGMVYENIGPFAAIKSSVATLKKTWGESLTKAIGFGFVQFALILAGVFFGIMLFFVLAPVSMPAAIIVLILAIMYLITVFMVFSVANTIFNTALYHYAKTGKVPAGFNQKVMTGAFGHAKR